MLSILNSLKKLILVITNNANYINFLNMFVVAFMSYKIAGYSASKPNKIKVKQLQLNNIYLPLFRLLENIQDDLSLQKAIYIHKKMTNILDANYELAFPQLHQLNKSFGHAILKNSDYQMYLHKIKHIVATDYELLKKSLGYPSENFFTIFIRMTFKQKMYSLISWVNVILVFIVFTSTLFSNSSNHFVHDMLSLSIVMILPVIIINIWVLNLKD